MKKVKSKKNLFILILLIVISSTVAYLYSSDTFQNIFVAASYKVRVVETFESPNNWKPGDTTPKTATLKNEGTVPIKVRVKLEESWKDSNNQDLPLQHNNENVAIINFANQDDYIYKDGYYYYDLALNPGETTSSIIESVTFNPNYSGTITCIENDDSTHTCSSSESGYEGGTYKLTLTIEGVQEDYYVQAWGLSSAVERQYLYDVLKKEAESNGLAREYTGDHHDSFTEEPSQKIYHWYASNNTQGTEVQNKNNVLFGGHCWQMIRTTDTGGVKMIYNGETENNQCLSTRSNHVGYSSSTSQSLSDNYWYGTDYTYDSSNKDFALSGAMEKTTWNNLTYLNIIGKYTCKSNSASDKCSTLYLIESYNDESSAYAIKLNSNSNCSQFGTLSFNTNSNSPTFVGYKYGDVYSYSTIAGTSSQNFKLIASMFINTSLGTSFWYADSIVYDSATDKYTLVNPFQISTPADFSSLAGKYTFRSNDKNYKNNGVYYIVGDTWFRYLVKGNSEYIALGDSITDNGDGTYTINNPISITLAEWYANYANYINKYTCDDNNVTCTEPRYITDATSRNYNYIKANEMIMIGKSRSGTTLIDTILVRKDELVKNSINYSDYKYTCNTNNSICSESTLRMITEYTAKGYNYAPNHYYGSSVAWDGTNYTLVDPIGIENYNDLNNISTHHFICPNYGEKECSTVGYLYYYTGSGTMYYITLKDGKTSISKILEDMFTKNTTNSTMKNGVEAWYQHYLLKKYDKYIEDTIFCNDRTIHSLNGWNPNGGKTNSSLQFKEYFATTNLSCTNLTDRFSVSNDNAKLTYKVGLISSPEVYILGNDSVRKTGQQYRIGSPNYYSHDRASVRFINDIGHMNDVNVTYGYGVRPSISLKPGIEYSDGDGSMENPYIVKMN